MRTSTIKSNVVKAGMSGPPLTERANRAIAGSSGRIVCRRLTTAPGPDPVPDSGSPYELRLCTLVILSWSAPQPVAGDSAVAQLTITLPPASSATQN